MRRDRFFAGVLCVVWLAGGGVLHAAAAEPPFDHARWDALLKRYVNHGLVDYKGLQREREQLTQYIAQLKVANPAALPSQKEQLAFWINAYNAMVISGVLDHAPIKSVKEVKGFFDAIRYQVGGASLTLNEIEARGRALGDWRIHFAVVCASSSCPLLRSEAYVPDRLEAQLAEQTTQFLRDSSRGFRVEDAKRMLWVSKVFKWYAEDFVPKAPLTSDGLVAVLAPFLDPHAVQTLQQQKFTLKFLDYDWTLNSQGS